MGKVDRLRALKVGVTRDDDIPFPLAKINERALQIFHFSKQALILIPQPQPQIQRHLVVPGAPRVQFRSRWRPPRQLRFDIHVDILKAELPRELAGFNLGSDLLQAAGDVPEFLFTKQTGLAKHGGVGF